MAGLNRVVLIGNLTDDPELRYTQSGTARTRFSIAINRRYRDKEGNLQDDTTFVPIVVWGPQAENCANYLGKGRQVAVDGRLRIDSFQTAEGERRKVAEVVAETVQFLGGGAGGARKETAPDGAAEMTETEASPSKEPAPMKTEEEDEEVPF
jgi:single-strand DNA-binding protein